MLAVRVDNSAQPNSRWYSGSGIYRHVRVVVTDPTHVAHWGVFVTHAGSDEHVGQGRRSDTRVANESLWRRRVTVETSCLTRRETKLAAHESKLSIASGKEDEASQEITVANPALWSPESPTLYRAVSTIRKDGKRNRPGHHAFRHTLACVVSRKRACC